MSGVPGTGGPMDFNKRLQEALKQARGAAAAAKAAPAAPPAPGKAAAPGAAGGTTPPAAPAGDAFSARLQQLSQAVKAMRAPAAEEQAEEQRTGPVGQGNYVVRTGDCISSIAFDHGFFPDTLWNWPENAELKEVRQNGNILLPGDRVTVPEKRRKDEDLAPEQRHRFKRKGIPEKLVINFRTEGQPRANQHYYLEIDGVVTEGTTDSNGRVEIPISPDAQQGLIIFSESQEGYELDLGRLQPITEISGVQGRLRNLGFFDGAVDGRESPTLEQAVRAFQTANHLEPTGRLDPDGQALLVRTYGS